MKRVIRNKETGDYLCTDGSWRRDHSAATNFKDTLSVLQATHKLDRTKLEQVLMITDVPSSLDVAVALSVPVWSGDGN
jgi:hypothetical protein